jgi:hypothetical protein
MQGATSISSSTKNVKKKWLSAKREEILAETTPEPEL